MTQLFAPRPSRPAKPEGDRRRRLLPPFFRNPDTRSVEIGVAGTILVHLLLLLFAPHIFQSKPVYSTRRPSTPRQFDIELSPEPPPKPQPPLPKKFVEANPNANNNIPDRTTNIAAQNQQVAQEKPNPTGKSDMPTLEGRKDIQSTQIVTGTLAKPERAPIVPPSPMTPPKPTVVTPRQQQNPLTGFEKKEGEEQDAFGSNVSNLPDNAKPIPQKVPGATDVPLIQNASSTAPQIDPRHPQPRPTLEQLHVRPAIFAENKMGTSNIGPVALDARWDAYAEYIQRMLETVQREWDNILSQSTYPPEGTTVQVKFRMTSDGRISAILDVNSTSTEQGKQACEVAITNPSPYGKWTDEMIAVLGNEQDMTFMFYYQ
jgi:hypothetical protein